MAALRRYPALALASRAACHGSCLGLILGLTLFSVSSAPAQPQQPSPTLYSQATAALLDRVFPSPQVEYLLLDLRSGETLAMRWSHPERAVPVGSLLKPFIALAYGQLHSTANSSGSVQRFPVVYCRGKSDGCWRTGGHGSLGLERALADSCNAYFLNLAADLTASRQGIVVLDKVSADYGLPAPPEPASPPMLIGVTPQWRIAPETLARAFERLATQTHSEVASRLLAGMRLAASPGGTAGKIGEHPGGVLAKTGTAPCLSDPESNSPRCLANGDGLAVLIAPAEHPRLLLLVRQRAITGALAAQLAGQMLTQLEDAHDPSR